VAAASYPSRRGIAETGGLSPTIPLSSPISGVDTAKPKTALPPVVREYRSSFGRYSLPAIINWMEPRTQAGRAIATRCRRVACEPPVPVLPLRLSVPSK
jgi:hypothetical protein